jgi:alpha/beta hydrolase family protein
MEQMMAAVRPFYLAEPDKPEVAARLAEMSRVMKADLAAGQYQSVDLRPLLGRITSPTLIVVGELDFIRGPAQAQPIAGAITGSRPVMLAGCGHIPSIEAPQEYRQAVADSSAADPHGNSRAITCWPDHQRRGGVPPGGRSGRLPADGTARTRPVRKDKVSCRTGRAHAPATPAAPGRFRRPP